MSRIPTLFFLTGACFALLGMAFGIFMAVTQDHSLSPAHGHLNLIGFVAMSVYGAYYALTPRAAASTLASVHFGLAVVSVLVIVPGIAMALSGAGEAVAKAGSLLAITSMGLFAFVVARHGVGSDKPVSLVS